MNKDKFLIKLQAKLDTSSKTVSELNKQIKKMEKQAEKVQLKLDVSKDSEKKLKGIISDLKKQVKSLTGQMNEFKNKLEAKPNIKGFDNLKDALNSVDESLNGTIKGLTQVGETVKDGDAYVTNYTNGLDKNYTVTKRIAGETEKYSVSMETLNMNLEKNENKMKGLKDKSVSYEDALKGIGLSVDDLNNKFTNSKERIESNGKVYEKWTDKNGKMVVLERKLIGENEKWSATLTNVNSALDKNAREADSWNYSWKKAFQGFISYSIVMGSIYGIIDAIKGMITDVSDLDKSLVELQKVTDLTGSSLERFTDKAYEAGRSVAKSAREMVDAATEFAKSGYDPNMALELGKIASMYTNIADEEVSTADAAELIVAQMKAFNIEAEDAIRVIDVINEVSNNFAVSSADIANNLGKASAVMANAGNSYEQMVAIMTAGTEITRDAAKLANSLKTITLNLQGMNDEGEEDLELMSKMEGLFKKLGISVYDSNGELKNTYDILDSLAGVYGDLTKEEKAFVTQTIAG